MIVLHEEIKALREHRSNLEELFEDPKLIEGYQDLLTKGLAKPRGFTLQTIDEKQKDVLEVSITHNAKP